MSEAPDIPERTTGDVSHAVARADIGRVPLGSAAGAELFTFVVEEPYQRRRYEWMKDVGDAVAELRDRGDIDVETLRNDKDQRTWRGVARFHQKTALRAGQQAPQRYRLGLAPL